jgi:hypothetical protein
MDRIGVSVAEVAELLDRPVQSVKQMRLDADHPNYRPPPLGWERAFARLARRRGGELIKLADELEEKASK